MNAVKKPNISKPHLFIEIQDYENKLEGGNQQVFKNEVALKPLRSAKNLHQMRRFNFQEENMQACASGRQLKKLQKLQEEKINLMQSLSILKESAVCVIAEKDEEIQKLKCREVIGEDESTDFYQRELERGKRIRLELEEEREQLHRQMHKQREKYIAELQEKEYLIENLYVEIQEVRKQLSNIEEYSQNKSRKIRLLQQQNCKLSNQLELSSVGPATREKNQIILDLDETIKVQTAPSVASSIPNRSCYSYIDSEHYFQSEADKSYMAQKMQEVERVHKQELLDLKSFYEKKIAGLRQIYERQLNLQTEYNQLGQIRSRRDSQSSTPALQKTSSRKQLESALHLNLRDMYSIQQRVENELQTSRSKMMNLKSEIKMQNLSECPSLGPRVFPGNEDAESQFTTKYFDVPSRFLLKRNTSSGTFNTIEEQESNTFLSSPRRQEKKQSCQKQLDSNSFLKKSCIFAAGLISGVTITTMVGLLFKKS